MRGCVKNSDEWVHAVRPHRQWIERLLLLLLLQLLLRELQGTGQRGFYGNFP
jgi:hypothetical protein